MFKTAHNACYILLLQSLRLLDEEEATDNDLRTKFKERWQRTPSNELYKPLRAGKVHVSCFGF